MRFIVSEIDPCLEKASTKPSRQFLTFEEEVYTLLMRRITDLTPAMLREEIATVKRVPCLSVTESIALLITSPTRGPVRGSSFSVPRRESLLYSTPFCGEQRHQYAQRKTISNTEWTESKGLMQMIKVGSRLGQA